jgi:DNA replication protein DnaC
MKMNCKCGNEFDSGGLTLDDFERYGCEPLCDTCEVIEKQQQERALKIRRGKELYEREIELEFRLTDKTHEGYSVNLEKSVFEYDRAHRSSIGIIGRSGVSKSRVLAMLARDFAWRGLDFMWINATTFRKACDTEFDDDLGYFSRKLLSRAKKVNNLFFDDIGSLDGTKGVTKNLHELLEFRGNKMLPMYWTSNESAEEMLTSLPMKTRERLVSRIEGKSHVINV